MKQIFFTLLLFSITITAQHKFAWISDMQIGRSDSASTDLEQIVKQINSLDDISFIIATGGITAKAKNSEFDRAKDILDELEKPLLIIPGNNDTKQSNSSGSKFIEIWDDDKFIYKKENTIYIGMNSAIPLNNGGHFRPEDINWLRDELSRIDSSKEIIFVSHHPMNSEIDNWFKVTNLLRKKNIKLLLNGHWNKNKKINFNGIPAVTARSTFGQGFVIVENQKEKIDFFEVEKDTIPNFLWEVSKTDSLAIPQIDSTQFINNSVKVLFKKNIKTTLVAQPLFWKEKIYIADYTGLVSCYNMKGRLLWDYDTFGDITGKPSIVGNKFIVSTVQGELTILDAQNGDQIETIGFDEYLIAPPVIFNYKGAKNLIIPKQTKSNSAVIIASASGKIYCYDLETLQELWTNNDATDMIELAPIVIRNQIVFGSWDNHLYSIDASDGTTIWKWHKPGLNKTEVSKLFSSSPAACKPVTDGKILYLTTPDKMVYAIDVRLGTTKWKRKNYNALESIGISKNKKRLYIKSKKNKFHIISARNGKLIKTVNVNYGNDSMPTTPIEWNGKIVFSSENGYVYRVNKKLRYKSILFLGTARVHSIQVIDDKRLMVSNMDGEIVIFSIVSD